MTITLPNTVKFVITDFDGICTDNCVYIDSKGEMSRKINFKDIMGFSLLKKNGYKIGIISGEKNAAIDKIAEVFKIEEVHQGIRVKLDVIKDIINKYNLSEDEFIYIGDDVNDFDALCYAKHRITVPDAVDKIKNISNIQITEKKGGEGAFREIADSLLKNIEETNSNYGIINIAFTATDDWLYYTLISAVSILSNAKESDFYRFYIISNTFNNDIKKQFKKLDNIKKSEWNFIKTNDNEYKDITHNWLGPVSCYRLKLPSMIKEDKVLYIDSDIMVRKDISSLYNIDISNYYLAAIEDKQYDMRYIIPLKENETYYNGGVQLINLKKFRENNLEKKFREVLLEKHWTDQDAINFVCRKQILSLPLKYNIMHTNNGYKYRRNEYQQAINDPDLMHYSAQKPWNDGAQELPFYNEWKHYENILKETIN